MTETKDKSEEEKGREKYSQLVCVQICRLCPTNRVPDFCYTSYLLNSADFLKQIPFLIREVREQQPNMLDLFKTPEGASALFCRPEVCSYSGDACMNDPIIRASCMSFFAEQLGKTYVESDLVQIAKDWSIDYELHARRILDEVFHDANKYSTKKRKKMFKAMSLIVRKLAKFNAAKSDNNKPSTQGKTKPSKQVNTTIFYNDNPEWVATLNRILQIGAITKLEGNSGEQHIIN